jgi:hypothetical protein
MTPLKTLLMAFVYALAFGQAQPNFSGTWKLSIPESDYSDRRVARPDSLVWKIEHRAEHLKYTVDREQQGKKNGFVADLEIGGEAFESDEAGIITAQWRGNSLIVDTLYNPNSERRASMEEVWSLSDNGKKLVDSVVYHVPKSAKNQTDVIFRRIFEKQ